MTDLKIMPENYDTIRTGIVELLNAARSAAVRNVNSLMTATYWEIGRRIVHSEQQGAARAEYGQQLVEQLAKDLSRQFGRGFSNANLWKMRAFYLAWPDRNILATPSGESGKPHNTRRLPSGYSSDLAIDNQFSLPWSAYVRLLSVKSAQARAFYETEALRSGWSVRQLDRQIGSQFYERIALSKNKAAMLERAGFGRARRSDDT